MSDLAPKRTSAKNLQHSFRHKRLHSRLQLNLVAAVMLPAVAVLGQAQEKALILASGERQGNYFKLADSISRIAKQSGLELEPVLSAGSVDNIKQLSSGHADLALVQSDIAVRALLGHFPFSEPVSNIQVLTPVFTEPVHILVRDDLFIFSVDDLRGKTISIGANGSGGQITSRSVLDAAGLSVGEFQARPLSLEQIAPQLSQGSIDAAFITSTLPATVVKNTIERHDARLLVLDPKLITRLTNRGSYIETTIPGRAYENLQDNVPTIGTQCLLIVRSDVDGAKITLLLDVLRKWRTEIEHASGTKMDLLFKTVPAEFPLQINPNAKTYLSRGSAAGWLWLVPVLLLLYISAVIVFKRAHIRQTASGLADIIAAVATLGAVWAFAAFGLYWCERHVNENFDTLPKSLWSVLVYVSGGFQARAPRTTWGERVAVFSIIVGVALIGWVIAEFGKRYVSEELGKWMGRISVPNHLAKHIVLINWDRRAEQMIEELHGPDMKKRSVVVIAPGRSVFPSRPAFERCFWVSGDATDSKVLEQAKIRSAFSIVILASWPSESGKEPGAEIADAKTIMTLLVLREMCDVPVTVEVHCAKNLEAAHAAGKGGPTEFVCSESFGMNVLTQCAVTPGLAGLFQTLLTFSTNSDEIYRVNIPEPLVNKSFSDVLHFYANRKSRRHAVIPIAVARGLDIHLNPGDEIGVLRHDDQLFVICDNEEVFEAATKYHSSEVLHIPAGANK